MTQFIDRNHSLADTLKQAQALREQLVGEEMQAHAAKLDALAARRA
jgi:hypothetical protein